LNNTPYYDRSLTVYMGGMCAHVIRSTVTGGAPVPKRPRGDKGGDAPAESGDKPARGHGALGNRDMVDQRPGESFFKFSQRLNDTVRTALTHADLAQTKGSARLNNDEDARGSS
jgi:hypothetical protein